MGKIASLIALVLVLVLSTGALAQKQYLVSPDEEVIPIRPGDDIETLIRDHGQRPTEPEISCGPFAVIDDPWPTNVLFNSRHRDVMGQWYVAPAPGTIDSIFFQVGNAGDMLSDSTVFVRVHSSAIGRNFGPGIRPGPYNPPCQPWGYWTNTNDPDMGVTAFPEDATDTNWISTYPGSGISSVPPVGEIRWGLGGYPVRLRPNSANVAVTADLGPLTVEPGDEFFISIQLSSVLPGPDLHPTELPTQFFGRSTTVSVNDEYYPSRNWKFYEHDKGPSNCAGLPIDSIRRGWVARGATWDDSLEVMLWNIWYVMTVDGNAPPVIYPSTALRNTFDTGPRLLQTAIEDCYSVDPLKAGVASASILFEVNGEVQPPVAMNYLGADVWEGYIPGRPPGNTVSYRVSATDLEGNSETGPTSWYTVVPFGTAWYAIDTGVSCVPVDISATGTDVPPGSFFEPGAAGTSPAAWNDGTAGPIDMERTFTLFGDGFRYAWIGVDGAIGLSVSPADTVNLNPDGTFDTAWTIPRPPASPLCGDTQEGCPESPKIMVAPFRANHLIADSAGTYGHIYYGNGGDTCRFIVQWDSIGYTDEMGNHADGTTFRVVLDACLGTVEFHYDDVGTLGQDHADLSGMAVDPGHAALPVEKFVFLNEAGFPEETRPAANSCVRFYPKIGGAVIDGWNLVSLSLLPLDGDYSVNSLFPDAMGRAWKFEGGYLRVDSLKPGEGYWMKFSGDDPVGSSPGTMFPCVTVPVKHGWNLIGGPSCGAPTADIVEAGTWITSSFFTYGIAGWTIASTISGGRAYWVKVAGDGTLTLCCPSADPGMSAVTGSVPADNPENPGGSANRRR